jgi:2'-5' RNA ligase
MDAPSRCPPAEGRYFVALRPSARARRALASLAQSLAKRFGGRAIGADDIHLTLAFVGSAPVTIEQALRESLPGLPAPGELTLDRLGCFGRRLLWSGPRETPAWLERLAQALRAELDARGVAYDHKPFVPHLTLVRGARPVPADALGEFAAGIEPIAAGSMRSRVGTSGGAPAGSRYRWLD